MQRVDSWRQMRLFLPPFHIVLSISTLKKYLTGGIKFADRWHKIEVRVLLCLYYFYYENNTESWLQQKQNWLEINQPIRHLNYVMKSLTPSSAIPSTFGKITNLPFHLNTRLDPICHQYSCKILYDLFEKF